MCNEWKGLFCLLVYKYKLLNIVFQFFSHTGRIVFLNIRQLRLQIFWGILCCSEAIQVYLKNTFHCEYYADGCTGHFLMFILSFVRFTSCLCLCILHEVRVPAEVCLWAVETLQSEKCKSWENVIVKICFSCALREINLHICVHGKKNETLAIGSHARFEGPLNPIFTIKLTL